MRFPAALVLLAFTLTACGGSDDATGPVDSLAGAYVLRSIAGQSLPYLHATLGNATIEVMSDTLVVSGSGNNGSFSKKMGIRVSASGQIGYQTLNDTGVYTRDGAEVTLAFDAPRGCLYCDSSGAVGTIRGDEITFIDPQQEVTWLYRK